MFCVNPFELWLAVLRWPFETRARRRAMKPTALIAWGYGRSWRSRGDQAA
jgi:hypothetical protein